MFFKSIIIRNVLLIIFLISSSHLNAQLLFNFLPDLHGRNVDGLGIVTVQNLTGRILEGKITIDVFEVKTSSKVVRIVSPYLVIKPGILDYSKRDFLNSAFAFYENPLSRLVNQTRTFSHGEYSYCYTFYPNDKSQQDQYDDCFDGLIEPLVPIELIYPSDKDSICEKRPFLSWQPPLPYSPTTRFRLQLTEKKSGVDNYENLVTNAPIILLDNLNSNTINYPSGTPELKEGKTYTWQVVAYQNKIIISRSEVWEFTVSCSEMKPPAVYDSYRELKLLKNGNYYIADRYFKFSFLNNYNVETLSYSLHDLDKASKKVRHGEGKIKITQGLNKIDLDLSDLNLENGRSYLIKLFPFNEQIVEVRFMYNE